LLETLAAKDRAALGRFEWNCSFHAALRADGGGFDPASRPATAVTADLPFVLAGLAAFGFVPEFLLVVELLLTRREDKLGAAIDALQKPVLKFHGPILKRFQAEV
jgi:hypothetical protein